MLSNWLQHPENMGAEAVKTLPQLIEQYPYCATYRMMYCIALANTHSTSLNRQLEQTACALPDRTQLFLHVNNGEHEWVELLHELEEQRRGQLQAEPEQDDFALIDLYLSKQHLPTMALNGLMPEISADYLLNDDRLPNVAPAEPDDQDSIIDQFLNADREGELMVPKAELKPETAPTPEPDLIHEKAFLTESLAKLYVKQHKFEQALAIFSQLNLQYPEKSSNFADQMRYLEKVIALRNETQSTLDEIIK